MVIKHPAGLTQPVIPHECVDAGVAEKTAGGIILGTHSAQ
jgi:hypothetical protein